MLKDPVDELGAFDESEILSSPLKVERVILIGAERNEQAEF